VGGKPDELVVHIRRTETAIITAVSDGIVDLLGWAPEELIGRPSTEWVHPDDQAGAIQAWMAMLANPGMVGQWVGRYRTRAGSWAWMQSENVNKLDDGTEPRVDTTLRPASVDFVSVEEELRRRGELISRLSEALPVGVFQVDEHRSIIFANDRFSQIFDSEEIGDTERLIAFVHARDRDRVAAAIGSVLRGEPVDDMEVRLEADPVAPRVVGSPYCRFSLRALTDASGTVNGAIGCVQDVTDSVVLRQNLEMRASTDELTGCLNRSAVEGLLRQLLANPQPHSGLAVAFVDLDDFKHVNDTHGHRSGDQVLVATGERLRAAVRACDHVGRVGGDEFLVVCPDVSLRSLANTIGNRLATSLRGTVPTANGPIDLRASIGVAWSPEPHCEPHDLIRRADEAMYQAKIAAHPSVVVVGT
jgi:diguanylate cyclase (GGDEF)-like protein/PAS domain S-box-containing protein